MGLNLMPEILNATIHKAKIEIEDHDILTIMLHLDYDGSGQGFGGYALGARNWEGGQCSRWLYDLMKLFEVNEFYDLVGKNCRVEADHHKIYRIGHIVKDKWFDPEEVNRIVKEREKTDE